MEADTFWRHFHEIYEAMPRQGPGDRGSTLRALALLPRLTAAQRILDVGCGSGAQTIDLAQATEAQIVAVDIHAPFVAQLARRAAELGLAERIRTEVCDMNDLPFADGSFDVVWSEGAIFVVGFDDGLRAWRRLLVPGGYLVVSDLCWLRDDPPAELRAFFESEGADVGVVEERRRVVTGAGYRLVDDFVLPELGWSQNYYAPLEAAVARFREVHEGDAEALEVAAGCQHEIEMFRKHAGAFGYVFFVMQRTGA